MGYNRGNSFPFDFEPNGISFGLKSKGKRSPRSDPIHCERKWKYSFLSVGASSRDNYTTRDHAFLQRNLLLIHAKSIKIRLDLSFSDWLRKIFDIFFQSKSLLELLIWNTHQKLHAILMCSLYSFQIDGALRVGVLIKWRLQGTTPFFYTLFTR